MRPSVNRIINVFQRLQRFLSNFNANLFTSMILGTSNPKSVAYEDLTLYGIVTVQS